jgi:ATP phosphoribosyltransferase regulatory subunit
MTRDNVALRARLCYKPRTKRNRSVTLQDDDIRTRNGRAEALVELYERATYTRVQPPILQPADAFLELSGEALRRRLFLTTDADGRELCLRPDLTIPACRLHIENDAPVPAAYCYLGRVFRDRGGDGFGEYLQAGIESLGREDLAAADAECLALALESARHFGVDKPAIRMGDVGLFEAFVAALSIPPAWRRRLLKDFNRTGMLAADLSNLKTTTGATSPHAGMLAALEGSDPAAARAFVADLLSIAGITNVGGRTVGEIAERFLEQASLGAEGLGENARAALARYLSIEGDPDTALAELRQLAKDSNLDLSAALARLEQRIGFMAADGVELKDVRFATAFGRALDYYTGMVFELCDPSGGIKWPLVAGGRYDKLMTLLGSRTPVPAVGFAAWIGELEQAGGA